MKAYCLQVASENLGTRLKATRRGRASCLATPWSKRRGRRRETEKKEGEGEKKRKRKRRERRKKRKRKRRKRRKKRGNRRKGGGVMGD
jgi:hypothetical protein